MIWRRALTFILLLVSLPVLQQIGIQLERLLVLDTGRGAVYGLVIVRDWQGRFAREYAITAEQLYALHASGNGIPPGMSRVEWINGHSIVYGKTTTAPCGLRLRGPSLIAQLCAAAAFNAAGGTKGTSVSSLTFSHTPAGSNRWLFVGAGGLGFPAIPTVTGVTFNGVAMTNLWSGRYNDASLDIRTTGWGLIAPAASAQNVVITYSGSQAEAAGTAVSFTGVDQTTATGTAATATGTTDPATVNVSSAADEIVVDFVYFAQPAITAGASQTSRNEQENINFASAGGSSTEPGGTTVTMSWSAGTGGYSDKSAIGAIAIKPTGGGGGAPAMVRRNPIIFQ